MRGDLSEVDDYNVNQRKLRSVAAEVRLFLWKFYGLQGSLKLLLFADIKYTFSLLGSREGYFPKYIVL